MALVTQNLRKSFVKTVRFVRLSRHLESTIMQSCTIFGHVVIMAMILLSFSSFCVLGETTNDKSNTLGFQQKPYDSLYNEETQFPPTRTGKLTRYARHIPFLAGAAVGAIVANNRHPTHHGSSYYYPPSYYPSGHYHTHG
ncbi:hypothetical protein GHT06_015330 [Daphnia sinensis]|uniref:Transmembrane protein n=1 Tax=Daphnia sinensis TaxID=1820382 RepID=A0AAD5PT66_9CRUS|nr:hypothetical protein GHT06_015330 [Daphnia sinensis]